jgi:hypothetical protein
MPSGFSHASDRRDAAADLISATLDGMMMAVTMWCAAAMWGIGSGFLSCGLWALSLCYAVRSASKCYAAAKTIDSISN